MAFDAAQTLRLDNCGARVKNSPIQTQCGQLLPQQEGLRIARNRTPMK
jgi:hypothetical protein